MSELDEFLNELIDRVDECEGSLLDSSSDGVQVWLHTPKQIRAWIADARYSWLLNNYKTPDD